MGTRSIHLSFAIFWPQIILYITTCVIAIENTTSSLEGYIVLENLSLHLVKIGVMMNDHAESSFRECPSSTMKIDASNLLAKKLKINYSIHGDFRKPCCCVR